MFVQTHRPLLASSSGMLDGPRWSYPDALVDPVWNRSRYLEDAFYAPCWRRGVFNDDLRIDPRLKGHPLPMHDAQPPLGGVGFPRSVLRQRSLSPARDFERYVLGGMAPFESSMPHASRFVEGLSLSRPSSMLDDPMCMTRSRYLDDRRIREDPQWQPASTCIDNPMWRRSALDGKLQFRSALEDRRLWNPRSRSGAVGVH